MAKNDLRECSPYFDECDDLGNFSLITLFRLLTKEDSNGCPVLATDAAVSIGDITVNTEAIEDLLTPVQVTKEIRNVVAAGAGAIAVGARRVDIINYDSADADVDGVTLPGGLSLPFIAGENNTLPAFTYNALTSKLMIIIIR